MDPRRQLIEDLDRVCDKLTKEEAYVSAAVVRQAMAWVLGSFTPNFLDSAPRPALGVDGLKGNPLPFPFGVTTGGNILIDAGWRNK